MKYLSFHDVENLNNLYKISEIILNFYLELFNEESMNKNLTESFISNIKIYEKIEQSLIDDLIKDENKITNIITCFLFMHNCSNLKNNVSDFAIEEDNLIVKRIFTKLMDALYKTNYAIKDAMIEKNTKISDITNSRGNIAIEAVTKLNQSFKDDILHIFLAFVQESIDKRETSTSNLTWIKYKVSYIYPNIEKEFIKNYFTIEKSIYINSMIYSDIYNISREAHNAISTYFGSSIAEEEIMELLTITNGNMHNDLVKVEAITRKNLLRSGLLIVSSDKHLELNELFHELIDDKDFMPDYSRYTECIELIKESFSSIKKDKEKHKILSLKK